MIRSLVVLALITVTPLEMKAQNAPPLTSKASVAATALRPGDLIRVRVWPDTLLTGEFSIDETGLAYVSGLGTVDAAGRTVAQLREELLLRYTETLKQAVIQITPMFRVSVFGAVERPGQYHVDPTHTLIDVIGVAGGFRADARQNRIEIIRDGQKLTVNASDSGLPSDQELAIRSGDRIVVPRQRRFQMIDLLYLVQSAALLVTVLK